MMSTILLQFITSVEDFQKVFLPPPQGRSTAGPAPSTPDDALLLCYEAADRVTQVDLQELQQAVQTSAGRFSTRVRLYAWDCSSAAFDDAKKQLQKAAGLPLLAVVFRGEIADAVRDAPFGDIVSDYVPRMCERMASFQGTATPARVLPPSSTAAAAAPSTTRTEGQPQPRTTMQVDVAKMVHMGKDLLTKGQPEYAEKFFAKALQTLEAVEAEVRLQPQRQEEYDGSVCMCLAWGALSQIVQGKSTTDSNSYLNRLNSDRYAAFCTEPMSDASRVNALQKLMTAAPTSWDTDTCSQRKLSAKLAENPMDHASRSMLVITLFLSGELERALTEAIKLRTLDYHYGRVALKTMVEFLGQDNMLVQQLGPLTAL